MTGRISVLVSRDLQALIRVGETLEPEVAAQLRRHTRANAEPMWKDEIGGRTATKAQTRILAQTARVSVSSTNVTLKSAHIGRMRDGTPADVLKGAAEFGGDPGKQIRQRSRKGKAYTRRMGHAWSFPRKEGYVVFRSVRDFTPRAASLWFQTAYRTVAEQFEKAGA